MPHVDDARDGVVATIAIPLHNNAPYIGDLLESLLVQWRPEFELLLIDDHSTDAGFSRVHDILAAHPQIRATVMRTEVVEGARLIARVLRLSRARIVIQADSDDLALPGRLDAIMACFRSDEDCRLVTSNALLVSPESQVFGICDTRSASAVTRDPLDAAAKVWDTRWLGATMAYHRDVFDRFPPFDAELCPYGLDMLLPFRAVLLGSHRYLAEPLVGWRQHSTNTHRLSGVYEDSDAARENNRALTLMVLAQKTRDAAFLAGQTPSPVFDEALRLCRQQFDAEFQGWCRVRARAASKKNGKAGEPARAEYRPGLPPVPTLAVGETLRFSEGEFGAGILQHYSGFHSPEPWGTWTQRVAHLSLRIVTVPASAIQLTLRLTGHGMISRPSVRIRIDGDDWTDAAFEAGQIRDLALHCAEVREVRTVNIVLIAPDAAIPLEVDSTSPDARLLGIGLISISALRDSRSPDEEVRAIADL